MAPPHRRQRRLPFRAAPEQLLTSALLAARARAPPPTGWPWRLAKQLPVSAHALRDLLPPSSARRGTPPSSPSAGGFEPRSRDQEAARTPLLPRMGKGFRTRADPPASAHTRCGNPLDVIMAREAGRIRRRSGRRTRPGSRCPKTGVPRSPTQEESWWRRRSGFAGVGAPTLMSRAQASWPRRGRTSGGQNGPDFVRKSTTLDRTAYRVQKALHPLARRREVP